MYIYSVGAPALFRKNVRMLPNRSVSTEHRFRIGSVMLAVFYVGAERLSLWKPELALAWS